MEKFIKAFKKNGYAIIPSLDKNKSISIRAKLVELLCNKFNLDFPNNNHEKFLNDFHDLNIDKSDFNNIRMEIINSLSEDKDYLNHIMDSYGEYVKKLVGNDILIQKNINIMCHEPKNLRISDAHRDAPENSFYEVVLWFPFVNCFKTKSMYFVNAEESNKLMTVLEENQLDWDTFESKAKEKGKYLDVSFNSAVLFWAGLIHGSSINEESETRWTMNLRFKNIFTPPGMKDPLNFFQLYEMSPLSYLGLNAEKNGLK